MQCRFFGVVGVVGLVGVAAAAPPSYTVTFLGEGFAGSSLNERGDVAGRLVPAAGQTIAHVSFAGQAPMPRCRYPRAMRRRRRTTSTTSV